MEIYEKKHWFNAVLDAAIIFCAIVFSIVILYVLANPSAWNVSDSAAVDTALKWVLAVLAVITSGLTPKPYLPTISLCPRSNY